MTGGVHVPERVQVPDELGGADVGLAREDPERRGLRLDVVAHHQVELGPVAGRQRDRLVDVIGRDQLPQHARGASLEQRHALAQLDGRRLVGDAEREQLVHLTASICSGSKRSLHSGAAASSISRCASGDA